MFQKSSTLHSSNTIRSIVFDLGGVLIDWNPRYLYKKLLPADQVEWFLTEVCHSEWNEQQDAGRTFAEAIKVQSQKFPEHRHLIEAYFDRWREMLGNEIRGTVEIFAKLKGAGLPIYALSNWSSETFHHAEARFSFLNWFNGKVVSGFEGVKKPDPKIFEILTERFSIHPPATLFIDDVLKNIEAAKSLGFETVHFTGPENLARELKGRKILA